MHSPIASSRRPFAAFVLALSAGCSLTLDWDRDTAAAPLDGAVSDGPSVDTPALDVAQPDVVRPDIPPAIDVIPTIDRPVSPDIVPPVDVPIPVDRVTPPDRTCTPACRGSEVCCNGVCRQCCSDSDCRRVCCNGECQDRC
jgi:hypothetical protein